MYERTDANGSFTIEYEAGVRYILVLISAHQSPPGEELKPGDEQVLRRYFGDSKLLGAYCLNIDEYEWSGGRHSLRYTFESAE
jgi:hypothetical protein